MTNTAFYTTNYSRIVGKTIKRIVNDGDETGLGPIFGLEFTDGTVAWIIRDEEGNGTGFIDIQDSR